MDVVFCGWDSLTEEQQNMVKLYILADRLKDEDERRRIDKILIEKWGIYVGYCDGEWSYILG